MGAERKLYEAINRRIPRSIHRQALTGASLAYNGTPDRYYDGTRSDLWVEFKALKARPRTNIVLCAPHPDGPKPGHLTDKQFAWLFRRWTTGKNAIVVIGLPGGRVVIQDTPEKWVRGTYMDSAMVVTEAAEWITRFCGA